MIGSARLAGWVAEKHDGQLIKRTDEPYFNHVLAVADKAGQAVTYGYEIGLCHDLLEDTATTENELLQTLIGFDYTEAAAALITSSVVELTDVFTAAAYPDLAKAARKNREFIRLGTISATAQTVKYADLIYNLHWVLKYDEKHALKYFLKKQQLLTELKLGNPQLREEAFTVIRQALINFGILK
jgi:(p)ppGpp synthase/HD superfamily hydrolase